MIRLFIHDLWDRWANIHPFFRFLILLSVVGILGLYAVKPGYRVFSTWHAERNLAAAQQAVTDLRMGDARDLSLAVMQAGNPCIEAVRILEKSTAALRDPMHGDIARTLLSHPEGSDEDRLNAFRNMAPEIPMGLLEQAWTTLPQEYQKDARFATVFAERLITEHRFSEVAPLLLEVPTAPPDQAPNRDLIRILIRSGNREGYDQAQRLIAGCFPSEDREIPDWLDLLEAIPPANLQTQLLAPIRTPLENPKSGTPARNALMLARLDYASPFAQRADLLKETTGRWRDKDPVAMARFLSDLGLYQNLRETFPSKRVADHPGLFPLLLDALQRTAAWDQVVTLLDAHGATLPTYEELAHRAVAAAKTGDSDKQTRAWNDAMREAKSVPQATSLLKLHQMAEDAGMQAESESAMVEAIRLGRGPLPLYADLKPLLNSLARQGHESTMLEICTIYLTFEADNPLLLTQYSYLACLNKLDEPKTILKAMEVLAKGYPQDLPIQCVLTTVYLCDDQAAKAAETLDRMKLNPAKLPPGYRAAYLTTQVLNNRMPKNDPLITDFPWKSLLPSERRRFTELIQSVKP